MHSYPEIKVNLDLIKRSIEEAALTRVLDGSGNAGSDFAAGWIKGLSNTRLFLRDPKTSDVVINHLPLFPHVAHAVAKLGAAREHDMLTQIMVNRLDTDGVLDEHRDGPPDDYRYHLPVFTNDQAVWWDEINGFVHMNEGMWYGPVPYFGKLHAFYNHGDAARTHLVVDFTKKG